MRNNIIKEIEKLERKIDILEKQLSTSQTVVVKQNQGKKNQNRGEKKLESLHGDRFVRKSNFQSRTINYVPKNLKPLVN